MPPRKAVSVAVHTCTAHDFLRMLPIESIGPSHRETTGNGAPKKGGGSGVMPPNEAPSVALLGDVVECMMIYPATQML